MSDLLRAGRPLGNGQKKNEHIAVMLTSDERVALEEAAREKGQSISVFVREIVIARLSMAEAYP